MKQTEIIKVLQKELSSKEFNLLLSLEVKKIHKDKKLKGAFVSSRFKKFPEQWHALILHFSVNENQIIETKEKIFISFDIENKVISLGTEILKKDICTICQIKKAQKDKIFCSQCQKESEDKELKYLRG